MTTSIGWASSVLLVITIAKQIHKQWQDGTSEGVSKWLFLGQITASIGFTLYSYLIKNWVFVITNAVMALSAAIGLALVYYHRRKDAASDPVSH